MKNLQDEFEIILQAIANHSNCANIEMLFKALKSKISRRTLQRRLVALINEGLIIAEGKTRGRCYKLHSKMPRNMEDPSIIPLSSKARSIELQICQPIQARKHVSYKRNFLDQYHPNKTYYLAESLRKKLMGLGKTPMGEKPAGTYARQIYNRLLIDLSWNSSRLEGNTYSLLDTERLIQMGEMPEGKNIKEAQMILNHKAAIEFLLESAQTLEINRFTILNLHAFLSNNLLSDPRACGQLRSISVGISHSVYLPLAVPQLIDECFEQIVDTARAIKDPFEQAFFMMVHLPYLQPFEDVNKRVSRLAANIPFIKQNLCPLSFVDVPEQTYINGLLAIYELNRVELLRDIFAWAYERSCTIYAATRKSLGEPDLFRMKHREIIIKTITKIVHEKLNRNQAAKFIRQHAIEALSAGDESHFVEVIYLELDSLHEGNIARYRLQLPEYVIWKQHWQNE